jgi:hypothetical protein
LLYPRKADFPVGFSISKPDVKAKRILADSSFRASSLYSVPFCDYDVFNTEASWMRFAPGQSIGQSRLLNWFEVGFVTTGRLGEFLKMNLEMVRL